MAGLSKKTLIRSANISDAAAIASVNMTSWQYAYRGIIPEQILDSLSLNQWIVGWRVYLEDKGPLLVCEQDKKVIGFAKFGNCQVDSSFLEQGEISAIYLLPCSLRQGIGRLLCLAAIEELKKIGFNKVVLWVLAKNIGACSFYEAMGFKKGDSRVCPLFPRFNLDEIQYSYESLMHAPSSIR